MVKGVAKKAVVVKNPGVSGFCEAIFISDGSDRDEISINSAAELLEAANRIADKAPIKRRNTAGYILCFLLGVSTSVLLWIILFMIK